VRDGIIADLAARGVGRELSMLIRNNGASSNNLRGATECSSLTRAKWPILLTAFLILAAIAPAAARIGKLLEASAFLHDIGHYVSSTGHHKHSYYLVEASDLPGFTDQERHMIALFVPVS